MIDTAQAFGVDIGGSGIKAAPVDLNKGEFAEPRLKILTPSESTPQAIGSVLRKQLEHFEVPETVPVGISFPAPVKLIYDGVLIPNTELGHIELEGGKGDAERYASSAVRERKELSYKKWAKRLTKYYSLIEKYFSPSLIVIGGGVSRKSDNFVPFIDIDTPIVPAKLRNEAGIIGAAYYASTK